MSIERIDLDKCIGCGTCVATCALVKHTWDRHDIWSILLKYKHLPPWTSQWQFRPFCAIISLPVSILRARGYWKVSVVYWGRWLVL